MPDLDNDLLEELKLLMQDEFPVLLETYLRDSERQLFTISQAWDAGDMDQLRRAAHSLKGASGNIGAARLAELCGSLETAAVEGRGKAVAEALVPVRAELRDVRDAVARMHREC